MSKTPELHLSASFALAIVSIHHDCMGPPLHQRPKAPMNQDSETKNPLSPFRPFLLERPDGSTAAIVRIPKL